MRAKVALTLVDRECKVPPVAVIVAAEGPRAGQVAGELGRMRSTIPMYMCLVAPCCLLVACGPGSSGTGASGICPNTPSSVLNFAAQAASTAAQELPLTWSLSANPTVADLHGYPTGGFVAVGADAPSGNLWVGRFGPDGKRLWDMTRPMLQPFRRASVNADGEVVVLTTNLADDAPPATALWLSEAGSPTEAPLPPDGYWDIAALPKRGLLTLGSGGIRRFDAAGNLLWTFALPSDVRPAASQQETAHLAAAPDGSGAATYAAAGVHAVSFSGSGKVVFDAHDLGVSVEAKGCAYPIVSSSGHVFVAGKTKMGWTGLPCMSWSAWLGTWSPPLNDVMEQVPGTTDNCDQMSEIDAIVPAPDGGVDVLFVRWTTDDLGMDHYCRWLGHFGPNLEPQMARAIDNLTEISLLPTIRVAPGCIALISQNSNAASAKLIRLATDQLGCP